MELRGLGPIFEAVAAAGDGDGVSVMEEAIQDGTGGRHVAQEFAPVLDGAVAGHDRRTVLVTARDDFQEVFSGVFGQGLELSEGATAIVAQHWRLEITNVLLGAERAKKRSVAETTQFFALLEHLTIESDAEKERHTTTATLQLGRKHKLTSYDAAYLELAIRRGLPLASLDQELRRASKAEGVELLPK